MENSEYYNRKKGAYKLSGGRERILKKLISNDDRIILDIGCGSGDLARILKARGGIVSGVDISSSALDMARPYLLRSFCFDIQRDDWPSELMEQKFDLVVASEVIEHIFMPADFLKKIKMLVAQGGSLIITMPNLLFWKNRFNMLFGKFRYQEKGLLDFGHIRFYSLESARQTFRDAGFDIQREEHFYPNLYQRKLNFIGRIIPGIFAYQFGFRLSVNGHK